MRRAHQPPADFLRDGAALDNEGVTQAASALLLLKLFIRDFPGKLSKQSDQRHHPSHPLTDVAHYRACGASDL
jgi:hypothetical protein